MPFTGVLSTCWFLAVNQLVINDYFGMVADSNKKLIVQCGDGKCIEILELQPEGKKRMDVKSFLLGNRIEEGTVLGG